MNQHPLSGYLISDWNAEPEYTRIVLKPFRVSGRKQIDQDKYTTSKSGL